MKRPAMAPGCFGIAIASHQSKKCGDCKYQQQCKESASLTLHALSGKIDVTDYLSKLGEYPAQVGTDYPRFYASKVKARRRTSESTMSLMTTLTGRALKEYEVLSNRGIDLKYCLSHQINPFLKQGSKHLLPLFDQLLTSDTVSREQMKQALADFNPKWGKSSISSHVATALQLFKACKLIEVKGTKFKVLRNVS